MSVSRWPTALAAAPLAALLLTGAAAAQDAGTPSAEDREGQSRLVTPAECQAPPAAVADVATELTGQNDFQGVPITFPLGEPADADTAAQIGDTARQVLACLNANDYLRVASLTTPNGARFLLGGLAATEGSNLEARLSEPAVARQEAGLIRLIAVTDPTVLADGRLAAFVVLNEPTNAIRGPETYLFVFQPSDNGVLLDGLFGFSRAPEASGTPTAGTPTS